ncbi:MAG: hypothetical protein HKM95_06090 [Inquilinus sp.]|nr:hypothetical protein [Inquilinus sp.]
MQIASLPQQTVQGQDAALFDYAKRIARKPEGRVAVLLHLSQLTPDNRREDRLAVAIGHFGQLVQDFEGQRFHLAGGDIVFACKGARLQSIEEAVTRLRYLFADDPLTRGDGFGTWYVMEQDHAAFLEMAYRRKELDVARRRLSQDAHDQAGETEGRPLTPFQLAQLEDALANTDLSAIVRNQAVCAIAPGEAPQIAFHEIYVSLEDLARTLLPGVSIAADPWLFHHLSRTLDRRVLVQVSHDNARSDRPFSINLTVGTTLSPAFRRFDEVIAESLRGRLVIELQAIDVLADMSAYLFAREYLRERRFKICIDGVTHLTLPFIDRGRLAADLLKLQWHPDMAAGLPDGAADDLAERVRAAGTAGVIMCRCDGPEALDFGYRLGVSVYQGRHIDALLARRD